MARLGLGVGLTRRGGGGGGAAPFDFSFAASGYTGMRRWHDADNLSGVGANVSRFANTAPGLPTASDYVQATASKRLVLAAEGGHQYLLSTETLRVTNMETDPAYANLVGTHMFALVRPDTGAPANEQMLFGETSVNLQVGITNAFTNPAIRINRFTGSTLWSGAFNSISITLPSNKWFVIESKLLASGTSYIAINGTTIATTTNEQATAVTARLLMAMDLGIRPFHGGLQTMVLYDTAVGVSSDQRTAILAELAARSTAMS